ncbi:hypothetical protein [Erwinia tasmaniensis]
MGLLKKFPDTLFFQGFLSERDIKGVTPQEEMRGQARPDAGTASGRE